MSDFTKEVRANIDKMDNGEYDYKRESLEEDLLYACNRLDAHAAEIATRKEHHQLVLNEVALRMSKLDDEIADLKAEIEQLKKALLKCWAFAKVQQQWQEYDFDKSDTKFIEQVLKRTENDPEISL